MGRCATLSTEFRYSRTRLFLFGLWACLVVPVLSVAWAVPAGADSTQELEYSPLLDQGLLGEGRQAYRERADLDRARDSYELFKLNLQQNPDDPIAAWHFSLSCYYLGKRGTGADSEARKRIHEEGRVAADRALDEDPDCGPCHLLSAINHALWAEEVGIFRTIVGLPKVLSHLRKAASLAPKFGGAAALRVHATIMKVIPGVFGGGKKKAKQLIEEAIVVAPDEPLNYEILADILIEKYKDPNAAVSVAERGLAVPMPGPEHVESRDSIDYLKSVVNRYQPNQVPSGS
ncbi:MAG: hypothetical protein VX252_08880 [Myxococcota bacterium]|nr:hypothetical protein [Myxococcota bacterium]